MSFFNTKISEKKRAQEHARQHALEGLHAPENLLFRYDACGHTKDHIISTPAYILPIETIDTTVSGFFLHEKTLSEASIGFVHKKFLSSTYYVFDTDKGLILPEKSPP